MAKKTNPKTAFEKAMALARKREALTDAKESEQEKRVQRLSQVLYFSLLDLLTGMDTNEGGFILNSLTNIAKINLIYALFKKFQAHTRRGYLKWLIRGVKELFGLNKDYFNTQTPIKKSIEDLALKRLMQSYGYDTEKNILITGGWLDLLTRHEQVALEVIRDVSGAIRGQMSKKKFIDTFRKDFTRLKGKKYAQKYYAQFTRGLFIQMDRSMQIELARQTGLKHALYAGTIMKPTKKSSGTRPFCLARVQQVYTLDFIDEWNKLDWLGKIPNTDVKITMGGYGVCRHSWGFMSEFVAKDWETRTGKKIDTYNQVLNKEKKAS